MLIDVLRTYSIDEERDTVDLIELLATADAFKAKSESLGIELPEWFEAQVTRVKEDLKSLRRDAVAKEIKETEARLEALKSADQKRADLTAKLARLRGEEK